MSIWTYFNYNTRVEGLDKLLSNISNKKDNKFYILCFIHYFLLTLFYSSIFFIKSPIVLLIITLILIFQILLNQYDGGCFIMKLERKYKGKNWFGPYTVFNYICNGIINNKSMYYIFNSISIITIILVVYKFYNLK